MEIWAAILDYEGKYEVSNFGRVRSLMTGKMLKPGTHPFGYKQVALYNEGKPITRLVQHLVAEAFIGPRPSPDYVVCHGDGNPVNNRFDNLRYDTQANNLADRIAHGTSNRGERHGQAKLTKVQVEQIRAMCSAGAMSQRGIAALFGVSPAAVTRIKQGKLWSTS